MVIGSIDDPQDISAFDFKRPVHAIALDRNYATSKTFVSGGMAGEIILTQRNWLGNRSDTVLEKNHGPIVGIYRVDNVLFWMNDNGITFYSSVSKSKLLNIPFPEDESNRPDLYWPKVSFPETDRILINWGKHIWQLKVSILKSSESSNNIGLLLSTAASSLRGVPDKKIELEHHVKLSCLVAGTAAFNDDQFLCLGINQTDLKILEPPELKIIDIVTGEELHTYEIISKKFYNSSLNDYHLGSFTGEGKTEFYLISSTDAIMTRQLSLKDRYDWYVERKLFFKAWEIGSFAVEPIDRLSVGIKHIDSLMSKNKWKEAANSIVLIFNDSNQGDEEFLNFKTSKWSSYIMKLVQNDQTDEISSSVPTQTILDKSVYASVLCWYLDQKRYTTFAHLIDLWDVSLFLSLIHI